MDEQEHREEGRGRSARKRAAKAIEALAQRLVELPEAVAESLPLSPQLAEELQLARNTRGHGSRKRQMKHLAGILRRHDMEREEIEAALAELDQMQRQEIAAFHHLEELRDRLCSAESFDAAMTEIRENHPSLDMSRLEGLARSVHVSGDKKAFREIFKHLRKMLEA